MGYYRLKQIWNNGISEPFDTSVGGKLGVMCVWVGERIYTHPSLNDGVACYKRL